MIVYKHRYEVIIERISFKTGRPLITLTVFGSNDHAEAEAEYARRKATATRLETVRLVTREHVRGLGASR